MPPKPQPIYTAANCNPAFQLNWSLAVFWRAVAPQGEWLAPLTAALEGDGVRLLEHHQHSPTTSQFLLSTRPATAPEDIIRLVKGRLQHLVRADRPKAFRRNYGMYSVGTVKRDVVENYVASQLTHHQMADSRVQGKLDGFGFHTPEVDLSEPRRSSHGEFVYNLHFVLVHDGRWAEIRDEVLKATHDALLSIGKKKGHLLSRSAVLADHVHFTLGARLSESPEEIALAYLNNLAFTHGMRPLFEFGYYAGTFGPYGIGAVWEALRRDESS